MLLKGLGYTALAALAALLPSVSAAGQSTFVSPEGGIAFGFSVPENGTEDTYFSIRLKKEYTWGGIGLGSHDMRGALYFIIYQNANGDNVTFSPRLSYSHMEPKYYEDMKYEVLEGTGIVGDYLQFNARCTEKCRSWPSDGHTRGFIDVASADQPAIYAMGPRKQKYASDSPAAFLKFHRNFGSFSMDMERTQGSKQPTSLDDSSKNDGATLRSEKSAKVNWRTTAHQLCMLLSFTGTIPMGVVLVRVPAWKKWHAIVQTASLNLVVVGFAMGIVTSGLFQKSHRMDSYHQVLGIIVVAFTLSQWSLGFLHHQRWKQTQLPTVYGLLHVWLGRVIILLAVVNAFLGFVFGQNQGYLLFLGLTLLFMVLGFVGIIYARRWLDRKRGNQSLRPLAHYHQPHQHNQPNQWSDNSQTPWAASSPAPWSAVPSTTTLSRAASSYQHQPPPPPPRYEAEANSRPVEIGLQPISPWKSASKKSQEEPAELEASPRPAELV